jgi:hypothetical protein
MTILVACIDWKTYTNFSYVWYNANRSVSYSIQSLMEINSARQNYVIQNFRVNVTNTGARGVQGLRNRNSSNS